MFGFGKKKDKDLGKKKSKLDKLVMGAIVGGAIGSVIGMSIAPKKGAETREFLAQKKKGLLGSIKDRIFHRGIKKRQVEMNEKDFRKIPNEMDHNN